MLMEHEAKTKLIQSMLKTKPLNTLLPLLLAVLSLSPIAAAQQKNADNMTMVELTVMNEGFGQKDRDIYIGRTAPIIKKYGMRKVDSYQIVQRMAGAGPENVLELDLWDVASPDALPKLMSDPQYQANVPFRDKIHNMGALTLYMAKKKFDAGKISPSSMVMVELVVLNDGYGQKERDEYFETTKKIAAKYGIQMYRSYQILQYLSGTGPKNPLELNLWELPGPEAMQKLASDADYQANVPRRDSIHNMSVLTLYMAKPNAKGK